MFSDPDKFAKADPFPLLLAALIILVFGAGNKDPNTAPAKPRSIAKRAG